MEKFVFTRFLVFLLTLTLAIGPGMFVPAVAASTDHSTMQDMPMSHKGCCPSSDKSQDTKSNLCASACAAMTQVALPSLYPVFMRQAVTLTYEQANTSATGRLLPPDYPPPKA